MKNASNKGDARASLGSSVSQRDHLGCGFWIATQTRDSIMPDQERLSSRERGDEPRKAIVAAQKCLKGFSSCPLRCCQTTHARTPLLFGWFPRPALQRLRLTRGWIRMSPPGAAHVARGGRGVEGGRCGSCRVGDKHDYLHFSDSASAKDISSEFNMLLFPCH